ncbi:hypothetical protein VTK26DRAFT_2504 [Humicola hyalothermophila]
MCIKLTRHFRCSGDVEHSCAYIHRCSTPILLCHATMNGRLDQPCMEDLESLDEWYNEACPDCTGEICIPKTAPVRTQSSPVKGGAAGGADMEKSGTDDSRGSSAGEASLAVSNYANWLARWLFALIYDPEGEFDRAELFADRNGEFVEGAIEERLTTLAMELVCKVRPGHGMPWRLVREDRWDDYTETMFEGDLAFVAAADGCDCLPTDQPLLCNWAAHIRRSVAAEIYHGIADPLADTWRLGEHKIERCVYEMQEMALQRCREYQTNIIDKGRSLLGQYPMLDMSCTQERTIIERSEILAEDTAALSRSYVGEIPSLNREERERFMARAGLLSWARFILAHDSGLSIGRARAVFKFLADKVVRYDPGWQQHRPQIVGADHYRRLAYVANSYPNSVARWIDEMMPHFFQKSAKLGSKWYQLVDKHNARTRIVHKNMASASRRQLEEINEGGTVCAICMDAFDDVVSVDRNSHLVPVQNRRCALQGSSHWSHKACLVRFARTLHDVAPRCPVCRAEFGIDFIWKEWFDLDDLWQCLDDSYEFGKLCDYVVLQLVLHPLNIVNQ